MPRPAARDKYRFQPVLKADAFKVANVRLTTPHQHAVVHDMEVRQAVVPASNQTAQPKAPLANAADGPAARGGL
jgi:hypothetical protein